MHRKTVGWFSPKAELIYMKCSKCGLDKEADQFALRSKISGRRHSACKECKRIQDNEYYRDNTARSERIRARAIWAQKYALKQAFAYLSTHPCPCGENDPVALDFDHIDPSQKHMAVSEMIQQSYSWSKILIEIEKCRVICSNCHRKHTAKQLGWYKCLAEDIPDSFQWDVS